MFVSCPENFYMNLVFIFFIIFGFREYINHKNKKKPLEEVDNRELPIFIVCDGNNSTPTAILGIQKDRKYIVTCKVDILGLSFPNDNPIPLDSIEKYHHMILGNRGKGSKVSV